MPNGMLLNCNGNHCCKTDSLTIRRKKVLICLLFVKNDVEFTDSGRPLFAVAFTSFR
jgi:hypothetical protein